MGTVSVEVERPMQVRVHSFLHFGRHTGEPTCDHEVVDPGYTVVMASGRAAMQPANMRAVSAWSISVLSGRARQATNRACPSHGLRDATVARAVTDGPPGRSVGYHLVGAVGDLIPAATGCAPLHSSGGVRRLFPAEVLERIGVGGVLHSPVPSRPRQVLCDQDAWAGSGCWGCCGWSCGGGGCTLGSRHGVVAQIRGTGRRCIASRACGSACIAGRVCSRGGSGSRRGSGWRASLHSLFVTGSSSVVSTQHHEQPQHFAGMKGVRSGVAAGSGDAGLGHVGAGLGSICNHKTPYCQSVNMQLGALLRPNASGRAAYLPGLTLSNRWNATAVWYTSDTTRLCRSSHIHTQTMQGKQSFGGVSCRA